MYVPAYCPRHGIQIQMDDLDLERNEPPHPTRMWEKWLTAVTIAVIGIILIMMALILGWKFYLVFAKEDTLMPMQSFTHPMVRRPTPLHVHTIKRFTMDPGVSQLFARSSVSRN